MRREFINPALLPPDWNPGRVPLFGLTDEQDSALCARLRQEGEIRFFDPGSTLMIKGTERRRSYGIVSGYVRAFDITTDGQRHIHNILGPGDILGLIDTDVSAFTAEPIGAARAWTFCNDELRATWRAYPRLKRLLMQCMGREMERYLGHMTLLQRNAAVGRVASFLVRRPWCGRAERNTDPCFSMPIGRSDIADHLGLTIETVSRCFSRLKQRRLIRMDMPGQVEIIDACGLEQLIA